MNYLQSAKNLRYTASNAETTAGGIGVPVSGSAKLSDFGLTAFFMPKLLSMGGSRRGVERPARAASSTPTRLVTTRPRLASRGWFVKRTSGVIKMANSSLAVFNFQSHQVRVIQRGDTPWFIAADICKSLGYKNTSKAVADHLDADEQSNESLDSGGKPALVINESGMYTLVLRSHKPEARKFSKWVTSEVLPSIRKTGGYADHTPSLKNRRWLVYFDHNGKEQVTSVPNESFVTTHADIARLISYHQDPAFQTDSVIEILNACVKRLELDFQARRESYSHLSKAYKVLLTDRGCAQ